MAFLLDFPFPKTAIACIFAFLLSLYFLFRIKPGKKINSNTPPEAAGSWPVIGHLHLLGGKKPPQTTLGNMADKYGPIFTIKIGVHRAIVVSNWEIAKECFTTNDRAFSNRPKSIATEILGYNYAMFGLSSHVTYWRYVRKIVTHELLSSHRMEKLRHVRESEVKASVKRAYEVSKTCSDKVLVDMKQWFWDLTMNVIFRIVVGKRFIGASSSSDLQRKELRNFFELMGRFVISDALPFLRWLDLGGHEKAMKKTAEELDRVLGGWLEEHKQRRDSGEGKEEEDCMDIILSVLDQDEELHGYDADTVNKSTCLVIVLAGSDTTAVTLIWALSLLLNNPNVLSKAQQELDTHIGRNRQVQASDVKNLVYIQAILKETMRIYPATPLIVPHESMEDCTVGGYHVPAGTRLLVNLTKLHQDPTVWPDPEDFRPERFLTTHKDFDVKGKNFEYLPFGSGRRICPGISFSIPMMQLALASLVHGFEISTPAGEKVDMGGCIGLTNLKATPLEVLLTPRLAANLYD